MPKRSLPKPRIFISHSAHEPETHNVLNELIKCLKPDFDLLVDKERLKGGDDFREEIFTWINRAHGAVVLFSSSALASTWVRTEASILSWRRTLDKSFSLVPVLLSPVTRANVEAKEFSPMRLGTLQLIRSDDPAKICKDVGDALQRLLEAPLPDTPLEKLGRKVAFLFQKVDPAELLDAARVMNTDVSEWTDKKEYPRLLAREMLEHGLQRSVKAIRQLSFYLGDDDTQTLIELVAPVWVSISAASAIPRIATEQDKALRRLWVNGGDQFPEFTSEHFIRRACCEAPRACWPVLPVPFDSGEDDVERYKRIINESLKTRVVKVESAPDVVVKKVLEKKERDEEPVFVAFHPPGPEPEVIAALRAEFPTLTFFILTGNQTRNATLSLADVQFLEPKLREDEELEAYAEYLNAKGNS